MNVINQKGILFLAKMVIKLYKNLGEEETLKTIENDFELFSGLLTPNLVEDYVPKKSFQNKELVWDEKNAPEIVKRLKLTSLQTLLLKTIIKNNNKSSLSKIEKEFLKKGYDISTGSVVGGSIAGISKKCSKNKIPMFINAIKQNEEIYYSIMPEVADNITPHLN